MESLHTFLMLFVVICKSNALIRPSNGLRECRMNSSLTALEVLPGGGWDNLRNIDVGRVMNFSYSQCQTTEDGIYLIPDEVFVIPQKTSGVETHSETIMSWLEQKSSTSGSINADISFPPVLNGKFSEQNTRMKTHQVRTNSVTTRVQVRNHLYTVNAYPDFTLDSRFAQQIGEIADATENNQTRLATYLSEKLILDYGTHVITSVDAGAILVQEDYIKRSYVSNSESDKSSVSASAGINFFNKVNFNFGSKESQETSETITYQQNITYSLVQSHGGALFYQGITLQKWQESTQNNLVAIDRSGVPLHYFLNPSMFPDLPVPTLHKLALSVQQAAARYYNINTIPGCVDPNSPNFNFQANVNDSSCKGPVTNLTFGGVYQICTPSAQDGKVICDELAQKNPDTGGYTCRQPYSASLLHSETVEQGYNQYECHRKCHSCWLIFDCCDNVCGNAYYVRRAKINTYWCSTSQTVPQYSGYLFGGLFGPSFQNPQTKSHDCPPNYFAQTFLTNGMRICLSNDYEAATVSSVPFGGFFSCRSGNPLAGDQYRCPPQYSQHLAAISDGCQVLYCVQSGEFTGGQLKPIHLPPFTRPPLVNMMATNTVAVMTEGDRAWLRVGETKKWRLAKAGEVTQIVGTFQASSTRMSGGEKAGVACGVMTFIAVVVAGIVVLVKRRRRFSNFRSSRGYEEIHYEGQSGVENQKEQQNTNDNPTQPLLA
ncbi:macrophage expressed 1, tandem duplicate 2 [Sinocyclocheilus grahami]|uniref:Macrophage-expressed gene 1 protein n=1 Tax=Sinocyclocheilus grahami TaxID=75366 RepID=A0A672L5Q0_SINGR|nr:PREDICTED: macrophage-expressed gene 1 protein-like [Sinocyclocheilus grahami]